MPLPRDVGSGGRNGIVLNLTMSGDGIWNAVYSVKVLVGRNEQPFMLSIDSGSSDLWIASKSCSSSPCSGAHTSLYDPSSSNLTGSSIQLTFLRGSASGPIVWDTFKIGPYAIPAQALVAADDVSDEALSSNFVGLMGLALPPNSNIAKQVPSTETDAPDGATLQMNLFGLTPADTAPLQRFISMSLERPGSSRIASLLGIGMHPPNLVPGFNPSNVVYSELISSRLGDTFWRVPVMNITAWVDGVPKPIHLGRSIAVPTSTDTVALVDTGGSSILTTVDIANAIYGAWGIGPGQDGNYYVPCTTPMNISIGLANFPPIALHPLDVTSPPLGSKTSIVSTTTCVGQIQAVSSDKLSGAADIILGVAFLRNVYTVLSSPDNSSSTPRGSQSPRLGLHPVTDPITAMKEFHTVRVLGLPLDPNTPSTKDPPVTVGKKLSVGVTVLVCIIGFFVACGLLFGMRWCILERRFRRMKRREDMSAAKGLPAGGHKENGSAVDEDTLRSQRWEERKKQGLSFYQESTESDFTRIEQNGGPGVIAKDEGGMLIRPSSRSLSPTPSSSAASEVAHAHGSPGGGPRASSPPDWNKTHVRTISEEAERRRHGNGGAVVPLLEDDAAEYSPWSDVPPPHERMPSWVGSISFATAVEAAEREAAVATAAAAEEDQEEAEEMDAGLAGIGARTSMASSAGAAAAVRSPSSPRQRPRGPRASSGASISSIPSRMWHAEVGEILAPIQRASHAS